jgi:uncharacterized protein YjbI with pentapeptide repeats
MGIVLLLSNLAVAEVFQWEFVDPANPALGKKKSTTLAPDGAGANLTSVTSLLGRNLTKAYLFQAKMPQYRVRSTILNDAYLAESNLLNLQGDGTTARGADMSRSNLETGRLEGSDLTGAIFVGANLKGATLAYAKLQDANLSGAIIQNINLSGVTAGGFTDQQLYQTASYQQGMLGSIDLSSNDLSNWNFTEQHMENAHFFGAKFANAVFSNAVVTAADFSQSNLAPTQLYDTLSYKNRQLGAMQLDRTDLSGWNFSDQSMPQARITESKLAGAIFDRADITSVTIGGVQFVVQTDVSFRGANLNKATFGTNGRWERASFVGANLTAANLTNNGFVNSDFTDAIVRGEKLPGISSTGFTLQNLYSTKSYQTGDLTDIELLTNEATGGVFSHINLSRARLGGILDKADFRGANLTSVGLGGSLDRADFRDADLTNASLTYNPVSFIDFRGTNLTGALFERTSLVNADFTDATVFGTKLSVENSPQDLTAKQLYSTASYKAGLLGPITLAGDMRGWDFRNQDVAGGRFDRGSQLAGAKWEGANLQGTLFFVNTMPATDFRFSDVRKVRFSASNLDGSNFGGSNLSEAEFSEASLVSARFDRAQLPKARFVRTNLKGASFVDADLRGTDFVFSESLVGTNFTGADIIGADFSYATDDGFTIDQLRSTRSYQQRDLSGVDFEGVKFPAIDLSNFRLAGGDFNRASLAGANLRGTDLTSVSFQFADISNLNLTDAVVRRANFDNADSKGFTREMLESTASFKNRRLDGINLSSDDMRNWDFRGQDLREARFTNTTLAGALFDLADLRGATLPTNLSGVNMQRAIQSEGTLAVLRVDADEVFTIGPAPKLIRPQSQNPRDPVDTSPIPPGVKISGLLAQIDGTLELLLDENEWKSTLVFNSQAAVAIHGELKLVFDEFANPAAAVGRSFDLFDWPVAGPIGEFAIVTDPNYSWDLSKIYTTGVVQLTGVVPEPSAVAVFASLAAYSTLSGYRRRIRRF